jgi:pseudaminic acid synthase
MSKEINIDNRIISKDSPVFIIAELSCNHGGELDLALRTIDAMYEAGADCVKLQTSKPNGITIDSRKDDFIIKGGTLWDNKTLFELYKEVQTPWEWHKQIRDYVESKGMVFFSSPFDFEAVDFLEDLNVPAYKIASFEITDIPLIKYTASKGKPVIMSTGIATEEDISLAVQACYDVGNHDIILLKCTSAYPTPLEEVNLNTITDMKTRFNCIVGLSDHTLGNIVPVGAVSLGAKVVEKHFILNRDVESADAKFSMLPEEFKEMVGSIRKIEKSLGIVSYELTERVKKNKQFARSLYIVEDVKKGEKLSPNNIRSIRPGFGLHPKYYEEILGKIFTGDLEKGTALTFEMFS